MTFDVAPDAHPQIPWHRPDLVLVVATASPAQPHLPMRAEDALGATEPRAAASLSSPPARSAVSVRRLGRSTHAKNETPDPSAA